jgi:hypothetical protein
VLERTAVLTFALLRQRNLLTEAVLHFIGGHNISPFRETQAPTFLAMLANHDDCLIASVAQFEFALLRVRQGDPDSYVIPWNVDPHNILHSLATDVGLEDEVPRGAFKTIVSRNLPYQFEIVADRASA